MKISPDLCLQLHLKALLFVLKPDDIVRRLLQDDNFGGAFCRVQLGHLITQVEEARPEVLPPLPLQDIVARPFLGVLGIR